MSSVPTAVPVESVAVSQRMEQRAQKCAWCYQYLVGADVDTYNGTDPRFEGWMCHASCNRPEDKDAASDQQ